MPGYLSGVTASLPRAERASALHGVLGIKPSYLNLFSGAASGAMTGDAEPGSAGRIVTGGKSIVMACSIVCSGKEYFAEGYRGAVIERLSQMNAPVTT